MYKCAVLCFIWFYFSWVPFFSFLFYLNFMFEIIFKWILNFIIFLLYLIIFFAVFLNSINFLFTYRCGTRWCGTMGRKSNYLKIINISYPVRTKDTTKRKNLPQSTNLIYTTIIETNTNIIVPIYAITFLK